MGDIYLAQLTKEFLLIFYKLSVCSNKEPLEKIKEEITYIKIDNFFHRMGDE
jgi:hypothetical protein